jgi:hypothetical protein
MQGVNMKHPIIIIIIIITEGPDFLVGEVIAKEPDEPQFDFQQQPGLSSFSKRQNRKWSPNLLFCGNTRLFPGYKTAVA